jgi:ribonuclease HI
MPWIYALFKGQKVLARAHQNEALAPSEDGLVEIRYRPNDGRAYRARAANLKAVGPMLPDDACGPAEAPAPRSADASEGSASTKRAAKKSATKGSSESTFASPTEFQIIAYTDGACSGNPGPAGCGVIVALPNGKIHEGFEYLGHTTNNVAELTAILRAAEAVLPRDQTGETHATASASSKSKVVVRMAIHTDSQYAIGVLSKGWKPKANQELIALIKSRITELKQKGVAVSFFYVRGHAGVELNERADMLAREATRTRTSQMKMLT